ncbi:MAG: hypothetical protein QHH14_12490 [Clostridiales bacterium]|nr:hypothetical protein [Clostridiales bacterium]
MKKTIWLAISMAVLFHAAGVSLLGIPAFARKYSMTCKTCHAPFPKLKDYGDEFAGNGFAIADKEAPRYTTDTGDSFLSLLREIPVALRLEGFLTYNNSHARQWDFTSPYILKLLSGGEITKNISYYFYFFFSERGEVAGIEDAFLMFNNLFGSDLDFIIGQFQVSDPLFKRELRLTFEDYQIYRAKVGESSINLTYDRGMMLTYGFPSGTDFTLEILNGTGIGEANPLRNFDSDRYKNFVFRVTQDIGNNFRLGGFTYLGKEEKQGVGNSLWMLAADATVTASLFELNLQVVERRDDDPYFTHGDDPAIKTRGGFAELLFMPKGGDSRFYMASLFNWVNSEAQELDYGSLTFHVGRMVRRNIRATAELTYVFKSPHEKHARLAFGLVTAF